ncbi:hypothetical protein [Pedobacter xixiisoli]|uniref:Uncharacterized protein n=1 Tax=Pedobacter xixiisoli TaxID=1476464 RepID=A0A285ZT03_9SPHI|nr:hypothetical protein [Pedobacter xixiisoli]SOD12772.1 hypothetical protein SAMN06297358_0840 [Pedobacter xixiisoli]
MQKEFLRALFLILIFGSTCLKLNAQVLLTPETVSQLNLAQDSLSTYSDSTITVKDDVERMAYNTMFVKKLIGALKTPHSFQFNFDSLANNVSFLKSPNLSFRIITWSLPFADGSYKFYGTIQMATKDGSLKLIPLNDDTQNILDDNSITNHKNWYGARYYEIIPVTYPSKNPYYILLGWKGNSTKTTKKVIEVLSFDKDQVIFGKSIFEIKKKPTNKNRIVFEYNKQNSMTLTFDKQANMIVFDHLAPYESNMEGKAEYYVSDSSFDGYSISYPRLYFKENVELRNDASSLDELYSTPRKATTLFPKRKH